MVTGEGLNVLSRRMLIASPGIDTRAIIRTVALLRVASVTFGCCESPPGRDPVAALVLPSGRIGERRGRDDEAERGSRSGACQLQVAGRGPKQPRSGDLHLGPPLEGVDFYASCRTETSFPPMPKLVRALDAAGSRGSPQGASSAGQRERPGHHESQQCAGTEQRQHADLEAEQRDRGRDADAAPTASRSGPPKPCGHSTW